MIVKMKSMLMGVLIITTSVAFSQGIVRHVRSTGVVTKVPGQALRFHSPKGDNQAIYLSVYGDSLDVHAYKVALFVYYPMDVNAKYSNLRVGFEDGTVETFGQVVYDPVTNYCEYKIPDGVYAKLRYNKLDYLCFEGIAQCRDIQDKDYFVDFLNNYYK